ncbi:glycosyl hydrolase 108 family protein [uncultured Tenacibaculum sp.]|uniref:glycosyl hydrolase 108 family protein n=1 Tax=uncultured Tenacibaculum sp. TaxID=174713 RepID=UPI002618ABC2|nr:glycosyl hydrolase 108 family protein [uncultured Tenacibaculum sp.]
MASYELFKNSIEQAEGGYQNFKKDEGNKNSKGERVGTNHGISARFYEQIIGKPPTVEDMLAITKFEAHILFKNEFWDKSKADQINSQAVAETIVDHAINAGNGAAGEVVQTTLNKYFNKNLIVDKSIGNKTVQAINSVNSNQLFEKLSIARLEDYKTKPTYSTFGHAWRTRVYDLAKKFGVEIKKKRPN